MKPPRPTQRKLGFKFCQKQFSIDLFIICKWVLSNTVQKLYISYNKILNEFDTILI
jgi:hypothetical protein